MVIQVVVDVCGSCNATQLMSSHNNDNNNNILAFLRRPISHSLNIALSALMIPHQQQQEQQEEQVETIRYSIQESQL